MSDKFEDAVAIHFLCKDKEILIKQLHSKFKS